MNSSNQYAIGQLWVSETEPELGVCIINSVEFKRIGVSFMETNEKRVYSLENSPLKRVLFSEGDQVTTNTGKAFKVESVEVRESVLWYSDGKTEYRESDLSAQIDFSEALSRFKNLDIDSNERFNLRQETLRLRQKVRQAPERGLFGARVELIPHQLYVVEEIVNMVNPRVLLSDEVGLGKTIEACLVLHRLLVTGQISRVLILLPEALIHQWFVELFRKFNLVFSIFDEERCREFELNQTNGNPFNDAALLICGIDFLAENPKRVSQLMDLEWDLLIVDEAHHLAWSPDEGGSVQYNLVRELGKKIEKILLLSGTPEQLGAEGHFARLSLLDPDRYYDLNRFLEERNHYNEIARLADKLINDKPFTRQERTLVAKIAERAGVDDKNDIRDRKMELLDALIDQYGTGRAVFRNTRHVVKGFPKRIAKMYELPCEDQNLLTYLRHEFEVERNPKSIEALYSYQDDPRIQWLLQLLKKLKGEKVLLICHTKEKTTAIKKALLEKENIKLAMFHEDMTIVNRDRDAAWFAQQDGANLLICSEIGSEGRNFQFAHHLVLYDLPLNPELLEQRIGRLDRIGQKKTVYIHIPYLVDSPQEVMAKWYHEGLDAIEKHLPGGHEFLSPFTKSIQELAFHPHKTDDIESLIKNTRVFRDKLVKQLENGRDHLLELHSFNHSKAHAIMDGIKSFDQDHSLQNYILEAFELFGIIVEAMSRRSYLISPENCLTPLPGLPKEPATVTCDRGKALEREEIGFLSWDHPLVIGMLDTVSGSEFGNTAFAVMESDEPTILLETTFVLECHAASDSHIDQFLPPTPIRVVVDHALNDRTTNFPASTSFSSLSDAPRHLLENHEDIRNQFVPRMVEKCQKTAEKQAEEIIRHSKNDMERLLSGEIKRLASLKQLNGHIKQEEIDQRLTTLSETGSLLDKAKVRLDSLRLILGQ